MRTDRNIAWLLEMRIRTRGNPEGRAIVDRCLNLVTRAATADAATLEQLDREVTRLGDDLALPFGAPKSVTVQ